MLETEKALRQSISKVDAVLEVLDARLPHASANPFVDKLCKKAARLKLLNKIDLADPEVTQAWMDYYENELKIPAVAVSATQKQDAMRALTDCVGRIQRNRARKVKIMVVGIPNTGKSTLPNSLAGKKVAKTGNVPAVTRHQQRTSLKNNIDIYDTPGILWPVIEPKERALALATSGAISDTALDYHELAYFAGGFLMERYPDLVLKRYTFLDGLPQDQNQLIEEVGAARGCLKKGGILDYQKASLAIIQDLRSGKLGRISFETPNDLEKAHEAENQD